MTMDKPLKILNPFIVMGIFSFLINTGRIYFYLRPQDKKKVDEWIAEGKTELQALEDWFSEVIKEYSLSPDVPMEADDFFKPHPEREP